MTYRIKKDEKQKLIKYIYRDFPNTQGKKITDIRCINVTKTKNYITRLYEFRIDGKQIETIGVAYKNE